MRTIAEFKSVDGSLMVAEAAEAHRALSRYLQVDMFVVAAGDWQTSDGEPVFLRYAGSEITKFGREYVTATVDDKPTQIRPDGGTIQFRIEC